MSTNCLRYGSLTKIGQGSYGAVFQAMDWRTGELVAMKKVVGNTNGKGIPSSTLREVSILKYSNHPSVIGLLDVVYTPGTVILIIELAKMDLCRFILENNYLYQNKILKAHLYQLLLGVQFCHINNLVHRDLKPQNILINEEDQLKIADFGMSRPINDLSKDNFSTHVVTLWYRAPEVLMGMENCSTKIDIWSVGCIFAEMIKKKPFFKGKDRQDQMDIIFERLGTPEQREWPEMRHLADKKGIKIKNVKKQPLKDKLSSLNPEGIELLEKMLVCNPKKRIDCKEALEHRFFLSYRKSAEETKNHYKFGEFKGMKLM